MRLTIAAAILTIAALLGLMPAQAADAPQPRLEAITAPITASSTPDTTTTTTLTRRPLEASEGQSCPGWIDIAREVGWPETELPMVGAVTYLESRCLNTVRGDKGISWTAWQIHTKSWCQPNKYWPDGYLQAMRIVNTCEDLLDPHTSALAALAIWHYGGWRQWTTADEASTIIQS